MKRLLVLVSVGALLLLGVAINNVGDDAPVLSSDGGNSTVDGALPSLGPVSLTAHPYNQTVSVDCTLNHLDSKAECETPNYDPSITGFAFSGTTSIGDCTGLGGFTVTKSNCKANGGLLRIDVDVTHTSGTHLPCVGAQVAQVILTNTDMDTLTITLVVGTSGMPCSNV